MTHETSATTGTKNGARPLPLTDSMPERSGVGTSQPVDEGAPYDVRRTAKAVRDS